MQYQKLVEKLLRWDHEYYTLDSPTVSDAEYDIAMRALVKLESNLTNLLPYSPTQRPSGEVSNDLPTVLHRSPMLSLDNAFTLEEFETWVKTVPEVPTMVCEPKLDGLALSVIYQGGEYVAGVTRGTGTEGEDVTLKLPGILNIPRKLIGEYPSTIEFRGELVVESDKFETINAALVAKGEKTYANPRNLASGSMRLKSLEALTARGLKFIVYAVIELEDHLPRLHIERLLLAESLGMTISQFIAEVPTEQIDSHYLDLLALRDQLPYEIDGMVIKVNDTTLYPDIGTTGRMPKWAIAWKFPAIEKFVKLLGVTFQIGRTGAITPVAKLAPTEICGVTVSNATLHNADELSRLDLHYGDTIVLRRSGDVIPKITAVISETRKENAKPVVYPINCPSCNSVLEKTSDVVISCVNRKCPSRVMNLIVHFSSKLAMNISGLAIGTITKLIDAGVLVTPADLYTLTDKDLVNIPGFGARSIKKLLNAIAKSMEVKFANFIYALGIDKVGISTAINLAETYPSLSELRRVILQSPELLLEISDIGQEIQNNLVTYMSEVRNSDDILRLVEAGLNITYPVAISGGALSGQKWIVTGSFKGHTRDSMVQLLRDAGAKVTTTPTKVTDYVMVGESAGRRLEQAIDLGVELRYEHELKDILK